MDILTILATIGVIIGIIAGLVQVIEYLQKRRLQRADGSVSQPTSQTEQSDGSDLAQLRQQFTMLFNESELRSLSFDLGVDYESLTGYGKDDKARELVAYMQRNGRLPDLISAGKQMRSHAQWNEETPVPQLSPPEIPHNLPRRQKFVGREAEKAAVLEALKSKDYLISIEGIGGIGKSTLALEVAHICLEASLSSNPDEGTSTFDGFVWASAKDQELTLNNLVDTVARTLNYPGIAQLPVEEKLLESRKLLRRNSYLVIVDNFETIQDDAVHTFLHDLPVPSQGLITTREQRLRNARVVALHEFAQADALALMHSEGMRLGLKTLETATMEVFLPLYQATGGAPLAIKWAAGQIKQKGQSLDTVIGSLQNAEGVLFDSIFPRSWSLLSNEARTALSIMPFFSAPADRDDLEAASNLHDSQLDEAIGQLVEMSLLNATDDLDSEQKRYDVHPLTRSFAKGILYKNKTFEEETCLRLAEHYAVRTSQKKGEWGNISGFRWFESELPNIIALFKWANQKKNWPLVIKIFNGIYFFLGTRGYWRERVQYGQLALQAAQQANNLGAIANFQDRQGWILFKQDRHSEADEMLHQAVQSYLAIGNKRQAALVLTVRVHNAIAQGNIEKAELLIDEALEIAGDKEYNSIEHHFLAAKGKLAMQQKDYQKAEELFLKALNITKLKGTEINVSSRLIDLGKVLFSQGSFENAISYYSSALQNSKKMQRQDDIARAELGLAEVYLKQGNVVEARQMVFNAREKFERMAMQHEIEQADQLLQNLTAEDHT